jgi:lipoprotein-releasing system permease protein
MIIVFSVFNGLESVVKDLYKAFYPEVKVSVINGKFFTADANKMAALKNIPGVRNVTLVIEDNVLASSYNDEKKIIQLKGIDDNYFAVNNVRQYIVLGDSNVSTGHPYTAIAGHRILNELGADVTNVFSNIELFYSNPNVTNPELNPLDAYQSLSIHPAGAFSVQDEFDSKYVLAPISLVQRLFNQPGKYSSIEISTDGKPNEVREQLQKLFGPAYRVETRYEQNKTMYMIMGGEKWAIYAILVFVLLIATFNMVGALSMLVLEKQKDIAILRVMGALPDTVKTIFLLEGMLWALLGGVAGIVLGTIICGLQLWFGFVKLRGSFLLEAYPIEIQLSDLLLVLATILSVGLLAAWYPSSRAAKVVDPSLKSAV